VARYEKEKRSMESEPVKKALEEIVAIAML
jgi:hypothetical protein